MAGARRAAAALDQEQDHAHDRPPAADAAGGAADDATSRPRVELQCIFTTRCKQASLPSLQKESTTSGGGGGAVQRETVYCNVDDPDTEIDATDMVKGYRYGKEYVVAPRSRAAARRLGWSPPGRARSCDDVGVAFAVSNRYVPMPHAMESQLTIEALRREPRRSRHRAARRAPAAAAFMADARAPPAPTATRARPRPCARSRTRSRARGSSRLPLRAPEGASSAPRRDGAP